MRLLVEFSSIFFLGSSNDDWVCNSQRKKISLVMSIKVYNNRNEYCISRLKNKKTEFYLAQIILRNGDYQQHQSNSFLDFQVFQVVINKKTYVTD